MRANGKRALKIAVDVALAVVLVALMATALVQEAPHEWLGVASFALVVAHVVLNRRWLASVPRARLDVLRVLQLVVLAGLVVCIVGQVASSLVVSKHAFGFLPALPGAAWARRVHMVCSYWMFVFAFAHAGFHVRVPQGMPSWQVWAGRIVLVVIGCIGAYSFVQLGMPSYLLGQVQFAYADPSVPVAISMARYASVAVLVAGVSHYVRAGIVAAKRKKRKG
ncbi:MAG: DUF4405 domain-containing protein [Eggerthellaceae bacterium]|nr:DUF4405 domain-containing protein [Eggerthellaceae bacterium]